MFKQTPITLLLSCSLSCYGQVAIIGGTATTAVTGMPVVPVSAVNAPLISTPHVALPGSGSPPGAPLSTAAANDSRTSTGPLVYNPNESGLLQVTAPANAEILPGNPEAFGTASGIASARSIPFENGIQYFESGLQITSGRVPSLGEIARFYRARRDKIRWNVNNETIARMNASGVESASVLLVNHQRSVLAWRPTIRQSVTAAQPAYSMPDQELSRTESENTARAERVETRPPTQIAEASSLATTLPETGSQLPALLLVGALAIAGGLLSLLRR